MSTDLHCHRVTSTDLLHQLLLNLQLVVQLILTFLKGDATAALAVFDPDAPVADLLQETARTKIIFDPQNSSPEQDRDRDRRQETGVSSGHHSAHSVLIPLHL